jgi:hypothetical protein
VTAGGRGRSLASAEAVPDKIGCSNDEREASLEGPAACGKGAVTRYG